MKKCLLFLFLVLSACAHAYTRQDTLRGSNGRGRDWWDVVKYELAIEIDTATKSIHGSVDITVKVKKRGRDSIQIDLQEGMVLDQAQSIVVLDDRYTFYDSLIIRGREGNVYWLKTSPGLRSTNNRFTKIVLLFHGKPKRAINPPWDGGFIWTKDSMGKPWIAVACQGLGASIWWPCKDYQGDEPDSGMTLAVVNDVLNTIQNGRMRTDHYTDAATMKEFRPLGNVVVNPINTYSTTFYIGDYAHWHDTLHGEKGVLDMDFYPLRYNETEARKQWAQAKEMLRCFEWWMGPYPFYEDGYKLVEAPYLGMEHQSAIAYGNHYTNGYYRPTGAIDRSGTGVGMAFDFIIIHESGHEWFGNSITARDIADNWLHEGFTTYTESLFAEWIKGKDSAFAYAQGEWKNIRNDRPVTGDYGVNDEGSGDKYDKGAAVVHMIRLMLNNDSAFRQLLRGLNRDFYHKIVTSGEVEDYFSRFVGRDLKPFFDQYLRSIRKPVLEWWVEKDTLRYEWMNTTPGFLAPCRLQIGLRNKDYILQASLPPISLRGVDNNELRFVPVGWYDVRKRK